MQWTDTGYTPIAQYLNKRYLNLNKLIRFSIIEKHRFLNVCHMKSGSNQETAFTAHAIAKPMLRACFMLKEK